MSALKEYPCSNCSSELNYDSEQNSLKCLHCLSVFPIEKSIDLIGEKPIINFKEAVNSPVAKITKVVYKCSKCGQETESNTNIAVFECSNCSFNVINPEAYKTRIIVPSSILPFIISKNKAITLFQDWVGKGFWNDNSLKDLALAESLEGHYIPFWTFDANTHNTWNGESGTHYYKESTFTDAEGAQQTERIQHTNWNYKSGEFSQFFDDVLICGNNQISQEMINQIYPFDFNELVALNEKYLLGWHAKSFDKDMLESYELSRKYMNSIVFEQAVNLLKDDTYKDLEVETSFYDETYKHILLPIWYCSYIFKNKKYFFIINGQSGKITGNKPFSASKIALAVIIGCVILFLLLALISSK